MQRLELLKKYFANNRLDEYKEILRFALESKYKVVGVNDSILPLKETEDNLLILRHDVDHPSNGTLAMAKIENDLGLKSTFYFRWSTFNPPLIKQIFDMEHEVSLHYETFADYAIKKHLNSQKDKIMETDIVECRSNLKNEIAEFISRCASFGVMLNIKTIASHGHVLNKLFNFPNNHLVKSSHYEELGILMEAYDQTYISRLNVYISDQVIEINNGYRYGITPFQAIKKGEKRILFLTHPCHWSYSFLKRAKKLTKVLLKGSISKNESFKY